MVLCRKSDRRGDMIGEVMNHVNRFPWDNHRRDWDHARDCAVHGLRLFRG